MFTKKIIAAIAIAVLVFIGLIYLITWMYTNDSYFQIVEILNNNMLTPIEGKPHLLDKPLKEFYINTSHNSYIQNIQHGSVISRDTIKNVLQKGARSIEIDVHMRDGILVVAHGNATLITTTTIPLELILQDIRDYGFLTSDPLILNIEIPAARINPELNIQLNNMLLQYLGDKMLDKRYKEGYDGYDYLYMEDIPIRDLLNKVIIFTEVVDPLSMVNDKNWRFDNKSTEDFIKDNNDKMYRIYLAGSIESAISSNFDPEPFWKQKCNMVALNFSSYDLNLLKNFKMFQKNSFIHFSEYNQQ